MKHVRLIYDRLFSEGLRRGLFLSDVEPEPGERLIRQGDRTYVDFLTAGYLGFDDHPAVIRRMQCAVQDRGTGRYLTRIFGTSAAVASLEDSLCSFLEAVHVTAFPSISLLHWGVLFVLMRACGHVFVDDRVHMSVRRALATTGVFCRRVHLFRHNDVEHCRELLENVSAGGPPVIVTEGVFSITGDVSPIPDLHALAVEHDGLLYVDDAHGFGCLGARGKGACARLLPRSQNILYVGCLRKPFGTYGAFLAHNTEELENLATNAFSFSFSGPLPDTHAIAAREALRLFTEEDGQRRLQRLRDNVARVVDGCRRAGFAVRTCGGPIVSLGLDAQEVRSLSIHLKDAGVACGAIGFPAVARSQYYIRFRCLHATLGSR